MGQRGWFRSAITPLLLSAAALGCGDGTPKRDTAAYTGPSNKDMIADFGEMLKSYIKEYKKPPTKSAEIERLGPAFGDAERGLKNKTIVYQWGQGFGTDAAAARTVLAYEKDVETSGGWALMQD